MASFATIDDLESRLGRSFTPTETSQATAFLADAEDVIRARFHLVDPVPNVVRKVCCAMVLRVLRNPDGKRQESIDDYSYTIDSSRSTGQVYLPESEADEISSALRPFGSGTAFSIVPGYPAAM